MLSKHDFHTYLSSGIHFLDGATGSNLMASGMPKKCCAEQWILENPDALISLQQGYADAGSHILYAPTFQAQPLALEKVGLAQETESVNARLIALSRKAGPNCLIAGDLTTMAACLETWDPDNYDIMVENYRRQIRGLIDGGADLLIGETLLYQNEAEAILEAADLENAGAVMISFTMQSDGKLYSGAEAGPVLKNLEALGADAIGFNCVAADEMTAGLVSKLRRYTKAPLICKPNAGKPIPDKDGNSHYNMDPDLFSCVLQECAANGAVLLGGCCGTTPEHIRASVQKILIRK